jgi:hypothetical protein
MLVQPSAAGALVYESNPNSYHCFSRNGMGRLDFAGEDRLLRAERGVAASTLVRRCPPELRSDSAAGLRVGVEFGLLGSLGHPVLQRELDLAKSSHIEYAYMYIHR